MIGKRWRTEAEGWSRGGYPVVSEPWVDQSGTAAHGSAEMARRGCCCERCNAYRSRMRAARMRAATREMRRLGAKGFGGQ